MKLPERDRHWTPEFASEYQRDVWDAAMPYVKDWRLAVDCGAHVGIFTRRMEERFAEVYAFEPLADNFRCLVQNTTKARLFNCLLWEDPTRLAMKLTDHHNSGAGEIDPFMIGDYPAIDLDAFELRVVDLIKLDVQDSEFHVIRGAGRTLRRNKPVLIVENSGRDPRLVPALEGFNYKHVATVRRDSVWVCE